MHINKLNMLVLISIFNLKVLSFFKATTFKDQLLIIIFREKDVKAVVFKLMKNAASEQHIQMRF